LQFLQSILQGIATLLQNEEATLRRDAAFRKEKGALFERNFIWTDEKSKSCTG
jgi:hypothetical protein